MLVVSLHTNKIKEPQSKLMKRIVNGIALSVIAVLALISCSDVNGLSQKYTISGTSLQTLYGVNMAFLKSTNENQTVDSCEIVHGEFAMNGNADSTVCASLTLGQMTVPVVLEPGNISVNFANSSLKVGGTPLNDRLYQFLGSRDSLIMLVQELEPRQYQMILNGMSTDEISKVLGEEEADLREKIQSIDTNFISSNYDNVLGVTWFLSLCQEVSMAFGFPTTSPMLEELYYKAPESFKTNKDIVEFMNKVNGK